jgi:Tfp pilus assembly protein PilP
MKPLTRLSLLIVPALALCVVGCKQATPVDATQPLQQSFQTAAPEVQQVIATVNNSLKANNYTEATKALAPVVTQRVLTDPQKQAVGVALQQINQAIAANPALDTKEMYQLRAQMFRAVQSGPRF